MLKIDNIDALRKQVNDVWNDPDYAKIPNEKERIDAIHEKQAIKYDKSNGQLEKSFWNNLLPLASRFTKPILLLVALANYR